MIFRKGKKVLLVFACLGVTFTAACSQTEKGDKKLQTAQESPQKAETAQNAPILEKATPDKIKTAVIQSLGYTEAKGEQKITDISIKNNDQVTIQFVSAANAAGNLLAFSIQQDIANILWGIKKSNLKIASVQLISTQLSAGQSGKAVQKKLLDVMYSNERIQKTDFESMNTNSMLSLADTVIYLDPALANK